VKLVVRLKSLPSPEQATALAATLHLCDQIAGEVSQIAFDKRVFSREPLQKLFYTRVKARGLSAQPAVHVIRKVADAYSTLHAQIEMGLLGGEWSRKRRKAESKPVASAMTRPSPMTIGVCPGRSIPAPCRSGRRPGRCGRFQGEADADPLLRRCLLRPCAG
jgi:hypothetical protein